jgi:uncharacterized protein (DUF305 family)
VKSRLAVLVLALTVIAAMTSCGHSGSARIEQPAPHNAADVAFARNMLPHHQQGVELAAMVQTRTANPDLRVIAAHIAADQQAEIRTLNLLLAQWHEQAHPEGGDHAGHEQMPMVGMVDQHTMDKLQSLDGAAFDTLWAQSMIKHHQGAVRMAQEEINHGQSADAIHVAELIVEAQQREIAIMTHLISEVQ